MVDDAVLTVPVRMCGIAADDDPTLPLDAVVRLIENEAAAAFPNLARASVEIVLATEIGKLGIADHLVHVGPTL